MSVKSVYRHVINDVIEKMRPEFEAQGYGMMLIHVPANHSDAATLQMLRRLWVGVLCSRLTIQERKLEFYMDPAAHQQQFSLPSGMPLMSWPGNQGT
jgi:hypothetical protein